MAISIESCRRGWVPILDDGVHRFSLDYWNYLQTHHPDIEMTKPTITAKGALWKYLGFPGVPGKNIVHKVHRADQNSMDLQKPSSMTNEVFRAMYEPLIAGLAELVDAGNSVVVRIPTPVIDPETPLRDQTAALEECLRVGYRLANLYRSAQQV